MAPYVVSAAAGAGGTLYDLRGIVVHRLKLLNDQNTFSLCPLCLHRNPVSVSVFVFVSVSVP